MHWEEKGIIGKAGVLKMAKNKKEEIASKWSEDWVPLKNIMNGMIQLENGEYVTGVKIAPKNIFILDAGTRDNVIYQLRNFNEIKKEGILFYQSEDELKKTIKDLIDQEKIHCCQIAVEGIVYEDVYVTDHHNVLEKHQWLKDIKKEICNSFCVL